MRSVSYLKKIMFNVVILYGKSRWPTGLRRLIQVLVLVRDRGFKSHAWQHLQTISLRKERNTTIIACIPHLLRNNIVQIPLLTNFVAAGMDDRRTTLTSQIQGIHRCMHLRNNISMYVSKNIRVLTYKRFHWAKNEIQQ